MNIEQVKNEVKKNDGKAKKLYDLKQRKFMNTIKKSTRVNMRQQAITYILKKEMQ